MDEDKKKLALRMVPYGIYVLTAKNDEAIAAATVNWVTQTSFNPPLVVVGVKADSGALKILKGSENFALNMLGKEQVGAAFTFFKPAEHSDGKISGEEYELGAAGSPLLKSAPASVEFKVAEILERGDHHIVVGEATDVHTNVDFEGRPDDTILHMRDLGDSVFYGG